MRAPFKVREKVAAGVHGMDTFYIPSGRCSESGLELYALGSGFQLCDSRLGQNGCRGPSYAIHIYGDDPSGPHEETGKHKVWSLLSSVGYVRGMHYGRGSSREAVCPEAVDRKDEWPAPHH